MKKFLLIFAGLLFIVGCQKENNVALDELQQNRAPENVDLISPVEGAELDVHEITFQWQKASDPENDKVTYDLYVYRNESSPTRIAENLTETSYTLEDRSVFNDSFKWYVVANDGVQREAVVKSQERNFTTRSVQVEQLHSEASSDLFPERASYTGVYFNNSLLVMNGLSDVALGDVWSSADFGKQWSLRSDLSGTGFERYAHSSVILNDRLYVLGGYSDGQLVESIYSSLNGIDWREESFSGSFAPRYEHTSVVLNNKILVIGGHNDQAHLDDVLSWTGNLHDPWVQEASGVQTPFNGLRGHSSVVFDNKVWVIGGLDRNGDRLNEVWVSADGKNWESVQELPILSSHHKSVVFDDKVWVIGGLTASGPSNEVYYYDRMTKKWHSYDMPVEFRGLHNHAVIAVDEGRLDDGIYILGSFDGNNNFIKDVWKLH